MRFWKKFKTESEGFIGAHMPETLSEYVFPNFVKSRCKDLSWHDTANQFSIIRLFEEVHLDSGSPYEKSLSKFRWFSLWVTLLTSSYSLCWEEWLHSPRHQDIGYTQIIFYRDYMLNLRKKRFRKNLNRTIGVIKTGRGSWWSQYSLLQSFVFGKVSSL
jgi:hypothetical protein